MARVMSDTNKIGGVFAWSLVDIFWSAAYVIGCMVVMLCINWRLALLVIVVVPFISLLTLDFQKRILHINRQARRINAEITRHYNEGISGAKTSKTLVIEDKNTAAFQQVTSRMRETTVRGVLLNAVYVPVIGFLTALAVAFVITGGGKHGPVGKHWHRRADHLHELCPGHRRPGTNFGPDHLQLHLHPGQHRAGFRPLELQPQITDTPEVIEKYGTSFDPKKRGKLGTSSKDTSPLRTSPSAIPTATKTCWSTSIWMCQPVPPWPL